MFDLNLPIDKFPPLKPHKAKFQKIGVATLNGLFCYLPRRHEDFSKIIRIADLKLNPVRSREGSQRASTSNGVNEAVTIHGQITSVKNIFTRKRGLILTEAVIKDESGSIMAMWFNQPYLTKSLPVGALVNIAGKPTIGKKGLYFPNPTYERIFNINKIENIHTGRLVPIYPETKGVSSRWLRHIIYPLLSLIENAKDFMPLEIKRKEKLATFSYALRQIHFPSNNESLEKARKRLAFDESFLIQLSALKQRKDWNENYSIPIAFHEKITKKFTASLPFKLTDAQRKAAWEIIRDLQKDKPMNRLLNGDVGSGKTIVAAIASLQVCLGGQQVALMAPTEILAKQHHMTLSGLLGPFGIKCGLLTSDLKLKNKNNLLKEIESGEINFVIGTHSLIQGKVKFKNLALVIVDEQHRFGVNQRAALQNKFSSLYKGNDRRDFEFKKIPLNPPFLKGEIKTIPHLLSMTATPIPRTLALTIYGDLDISILDEMPKGRQKIVTQIITPDARAMAYEFIRREIKKGRQAFVVCPRIENANGEPSPQPSPYQNRERELAKTPSPSVEGKNWNENSPLNWSRYSLFSWDEGSSIKTEIKSVKAEYKKLSEEIFPEFKIEMMHGQLKPDKKEEIIKNFRENKIQILVSTSVIEVGVDMPNASIMMIEGAERFGLAQLHQFRGRIGRGEHQSYCLIFKEDAGESVRLKALIKCQDGFELAEKDLEIRGPGNFYGSEQWGLNNSTINILTDARLIKTIRESAGWLVKNDPELNKYPLLKEKLKEFRKIQHFE